jgi:hypothetical protein
MTRIGPTKLISIGLVAALGACTTELDEPTPVEPPGTGEPGNTFNHENTFDTFKFLDQLMNEGPPSFSSKLHSCSKIPYETLGNMLTSLGALTGTAANLYNSGANAYGAANYDARIRENITIGTASMSRAYDIYVAASQTIIDNFAAGSIARCTGAQMFDANDNCVESGVSCLMGVKARQTHIDMCNFTVRAADNIVNGKRLAVSVILAATQTCH